VIVGSTGSGKTTLATFLATRLNAPHVELDALHWEPGWVQASPEAFRARVDEALAGPTWVADGNYGSVRDLVWTRANTLIWLDFGRSTVIWRLVRRTTYRVVRGTELWNGNRERMRTVFSRESLFIWMWKTHGRRRREFPALFRQDDFRHLSVLRFTTPRALDAWLAGFSGPASDQSAGYR
jgi:adenylate kinase family enzyme